MPLAKTTALRTRGRTRGLLAALGAFVTLVTLGACRRGPTETGHEATTGASATASATATELASAAPSPPSRSAASAASWSPPSYAQRDAFTERELTIGEEPFEVPATLTLPQQSLTAPRLPPAIVLVPGSGPLDRDATMGGTKVFKDLAYGLASRGIAVLRFDKPLRVHADAWLAKHASTVTVDVETTLDAVAAVSALRARPEIDPARVYLLGHSQGGLAAPRIAERATELAGLIVLGAPTRPFEDVLLGQFEYLATLEDHYGSSAREALPALREAVARTKSPALTPDAPRRGLPLGIPATFWLDLRGYHPEARAAHLGKPILVLQGEADFQVTMDDFAGWRRGLANRPFVRLASFPHLGHTFADCGCAMASPETYAAPGHVAAEVVEAIARWVAERVAER